MHQDVVKKGYLGLKWPKSYLNRVFYRIVIAIYVPTYPPIFGIKIGKIVVTYPFPIVPLDKTFVVSLWVISIPGSYSPKYYFRRKNCSGDKVSSTRNTKTWITPKLGNRDPYWVFCTNLSIVVFCLLSLLVWI